MGGEAEKPNKPSAGSRKIHRPSSSKRFSNPNKVIDDFSEMKTKPTKWSLGVLNDRETDEVPGKSIDGRLVEALTSSTEPILNTSSGQAQSYCCQTAETMHR